MVLLLFLGELQILTWDNLDFNSQKVSHTDEHLPLIDGFLLFLLRHKRQLTDRLDREQFRTSNHSLQTCMGPSILYTSCGLPVGTVNRNLSANAGDMGLVLVPERFQIRQASKLVFHNY